MRTSWRRAWDMQRILHFRVARLIFNRLRRPAVRLFLASVRTCTDVSWTGGSRAQIEKACVSNVFDTAPIRYNRPAVYLFMAGRRDVRAWRSHALTWPERSPRLARKNANIRSQGMWVILTGRPCNYNPFDTASSLASMMISENYDANATFAGQWT